MIEKEIKNKNITLKFHRFNESFCENKKIGSIFFALNNREKNISNSKYAQLLEIISKEYNNEENSTKLTLKHKYVLSEIEEYEKNNSDKMIKYSSIENEMIEKRNLIENPVELRKILVDLHKIGSIIYFDDDILRETIISDPEWFNTVFRTIMNYGRKKIEMMIEYLFHLLNEEKMNQPKQFDLKKENLLKYVEKMLKELKKGVHPELEIDQIWKQYRKQSIVDKISFNSLLKAIEIIEKDLLDSKDDNILNNIKYRFVDNDNNNIPVSQCIHTIEEKTMKFQIINEILGDDCFNLEKKRFLIDLLVKYDLILSKRKIERVDLNKNIEKDFFYLIPFLFPEKKPPKKFIENFEKQKRNEEWEIKYFLPFKPSSMWKILFLKIRKCCVKDEKKQVIENELYWRDGFIFDFQEIMKIKKNENNTDIKQNNNTTIVEMEIIENKKSDSSSIKIQSDPSSFSFFRNLFTSSNTTPSVEENNDSPESHQVTLEIRIKTNDNVDELFESIDQSIKEFISKWIVGKFYDQIKFSVAKKMVGGKQSMNINSKGVNKKKAICLYCSRNILVNEETSECEICHSKNFLIENRFAVEKELPQGGVNFMFSIIFLF